MSDLISDFEVNKAIASEILSCNYSVSELDSKIHLESSLIYPDAKGEFNPCESWDVIGCEIRRAGIKLYPPNRDSDLWTAVWDDENKFGKPAKSIICENLNPRKAACLALLELY